MVEGGEVFQIERSVPLRPILKLTVSENYAVSCVYRYETFLDWITNSCNIFVFNKVNDYWLLLTE